MRLGLIGHMDSGKTQLAKAIDTLTSSTITILDSPAEEAEKWLHDRSRIDGVMIVVSSTDGPMPYTRRHIELAEEAGIKPAGIWINKEEYVAATPEIIELIEMETRDLISEYGFDDMGIPCSSGSAELVLKEFENCNKDYWADKLQKFLEEVEGYIKNN